MVGVVARSSRLPFLRRLPMRSRRSREKEEGAAAAERPPQHGRTPLTGQTQSGPERILGVSGAQERRRRTHSSRVQRRACCSVRQSGAAAQMADLLFSLLCSPCAGSLLLTRTPALQGIHVDDGNHIPTTNAVLWSSGRRLTKGAGPGFATFPVPVLPLPMMVCVATPSRCAAAGER